MPRAGRFPFVSIAILLQLTGAGHAEAAPPAKEDAVAVVVAEGLGKDEKEARKAAFRDAVSKVVGSLIDSETLVKNDEIISERILEYSGGFVKTYDTLKVEKADGGLVRVRIKATVERLQIVGKLQDAKVTTKEVKGTDLLAEKLTKEEARKNAAELLAKLYAEIPKLARAEVRGKPELAADGKGLAVDLVISADPKAYAEFAKRATALLDKLALNKDSVLLTGTALSDIAGAYTYQQPFGASPDTIFGKPDLGPKTPRGYAIWMVSFADESRQKMRWNLYWVDADLGKSLATLPTSPRIKVRFNDAKGEVVTEDELPLSKDPLRDFTAGLGPWFLCNVEKRSKTHFETGETTNTASVFIAPVFSDIGCSSFAYYYIPARAVTHKVRLTDAELERVKEVKAAVEFKQTGDSR